MQEVLERMSVDDLTAVINENANRALASTPIDTTVGMRAFWKKIFDMCMSELENRIDEVEG